MAKRKKTYGSVRTFLWITAAAAALFFGYLFYLWAATPGPSTVRYNEFGISIPTAYTIHGIDVSRYQQNVSWKLEREMKVNDIRLGLVFI